MVETTSPQLIAPPLLNTVSQLSNNLKSIQPVNSETAQLITYTLIATAVVGMFVYHYIKNHEAQ